MCTVSIFRDSSNRLVLTSNRDEKIHRKTDAPLKVKVGNQFVIYPRDVEKNGTWIAMGETGRIVCLLNGGFEKHVPTGNYIKSRGQVVLDVFQFETIDQFIQEVELENIEPFTMFILKDKNDPFIHEIVWDGKTKTCQLLDSSIPLLRSSATLYSPDIRKNRVDIFNQWITDETNLNATSILDLHFATNNNNGFILNQQENLKTVSVSQILIGESEGTFNYLDILDRDKNTRITQQWEKTLHYY